MRPLLLVALAVLATGLGGFAVTAMAAGQLAPAASAQASTSATHPTPGTTGQASSQADPPSPGAPQATGQAAPTHRTATLTTLSDAEGAVHRSPTIPPAAAAWTPAAERLPRPATLAEVPRYLAETTLVRLGLLEGLLSRPPRIDYDPETSTIVAELRTRADPRERQREYALVVVQGIVSSLQVLELPVSVVTVTVLDPAGHLGLEAQVGLRAARTRPPLSWEPSAAGTRAFFQWASQLASPARPEDRVTLRGPWVP
jgi:hypothetical protein